MAQLNTQFTQVDKTADRAVFTDYLEMFSRLPFTRAYKKNLLKALDIKSGQTVLDAGCGLGDDCSVYAAKTGPRGKVTAMDLSEHMLSAARSRQPKRKNMHFVQGDMLALPFAAGTFDRVVTDRTLQHLKESGRAVRELARVLKPGGRMAVYANDWETFVLSHSDRALTRKILNFWCDAMPNGWEARQLPAQLADAGIHDITVLPQTLVSHNFSDIEAIFKIIECAERANSAGLISAAEQQAFIAELRARDRSGGLLCSYTGYIISGVKAL